MKLGLFSPIHVKKIEDIYMARYQMRFFREIAKHYDCEYTITLDCDETGKFHQLFGDCSRVIDIRGRDPTGIVKPTLCAIDYFSDKKVTNLIRITQDTQVDSYELIGTFIKKYHTYENKIVGCKDRCSDIKNYLSELQIYQDENEYQFIQGNFILASYNLWQKYYKITSTVVKHYCDDSIFTYLLENRENVKPTFIKDFWIHNRTKNIYYLENLYA